VVDLTEALPLPEASTEKSRPRRRWRRRLLVAVLGLLGAGALAGGVIAFVAAQEESIPTHAVPAMVDATEAEARSMLAGLGWTLSTRSERRDGTVAGQILAQDPAAGVELKEGQTVTLVISLGPNPVTVPAVVGLPEADARTALEAVGLLVGQVFSTASEEVPAGVVLDLAPKDAQLFPGATVDLNVSSGPPPRTLPDVAGYTVDEATQALTGLQLVPQFEEVFDDTVAKGLVIGTDPAAAQQAPRDSTVRVFMSKGPEMVVVPQVAGKSLAAAADAIEAAGLTTGQVYGPVRGTPISTNPPAGAKVKKGSVVDIYLG
jgi:serine/threonine-protein kinase